ncbi:hypothetical protein KIF24_16780 [Micromonospora sp. Llam7]|uniref:hypothetical protein n=1 Tax=Micromonospora tarapacensis TaxID=2835305 RepID=UPI001C82ED74|nr:hypothetical protein [Micromonospora tarapacensis]MBX7267519.1 hypothetical protein [Micromonospora tarapacensis]
MIDLAVISSTAHLADLSAHGSIDMALTHLVLANPDYAAHYRDRSAAGVRILLDNSAYELEATTGAGMPAAAVLDAAARINAAVVVCTDVLYDGPATVATTRQFLTDAADHPYQFMAVPQGTTRAEWLDCYQRLTDLGVGLIGLSKLSVPRCFAAPVAEARLDCADILHRRDEPVPLHLLGGDRSLPWELAEHRRRSHDLITSNDSSFAYWYPATGVAVDETTGRAAREAPGKPDLTGGRLSASQLDTAHQHIALLRRAAGLGLPADTDAARRSRQWA